MKPFIITLFAFITTNTIIAQIADNVYFDKTIQIAKFHTIDELENLKKGQLVKLYLERTNEIITKLPFIALSNKPGERLIDNGIPEDSAHLKTLKKHHESSVKSFEDSKNMIHQFIPYTDTENIIWSILYFEEIIKKMRIGINGNF